MSFEVAEEVGEWRRAIASGGREEGREEEGGGEKEKV